MTTPTYSVRKIGDRYVTERQTPYPKVTRPAYAAGGGLLAVFGMSRRSIPGLLLAAAGGALAYHGMTGRNPFLRLISAYQALRESDADASLAPSSHHDDVHVSGQLPTDKVEEASMESFPASDAPAHVASS